MFPLFGNRGIREYTNNEPFREREMRSTTNKDHIERTKRMIEVMQAYVDGEEVEVCHHLDTNWRSGVVGDPNWNWSQFNYRIAKTPDTIDWSHVAPEFKYMARWKDGRSFLYRELPYPSEVIWVSHKDLRPIHANFFKSYHRGTCDWKDSLVIRPGCE